MCHTGLGRCLFRLGKHGEAEQEFEAALRLGAGGPFHRSWIHLRLGNMADVAGDREKALESYRKAVGQGSNASSEAVRRAQRFTEKPYRGYTKDG